MSSTRVCEKCKCISDVQGNLEKEIAFRTEYFEDEIIVGFDSCKSKAIDHNLKALDCAIKKHGIP
jgi:hypothetical protein